MSSGHPLVLVLGATGNTGSSIIKGLLESRNFRVAALVRPSSLTKPEIQKLRESGVEIRPVDLKAGVDELKSALTGVDTFISAVTAFVLDDQKNLFVAAKEVGVKRVIPCDFGTPTKGGVMTVLGDKKLEIREFIKELALPYTFIDVGWWMQLSLPLPSRSKASEPMKAMTYQITGPGRNRMLVTDLRHIGTWVARIVADPRTVNHAVIVWEQELTQLETHEIGERASGEGEHLRSLRKYVSAEEIERIVKEAKDAVARDPADVWGLVKLVGAQYTQSIHLVEENTLQSAVKLGYLDAQELYPDLPKYLLEEFAKDFYAQEEPGMYYMRNL